MHIPTNDPEVLAAGIDEEWDIRFRNQLAHSPDLNVQYSILVANTERLIDAVKKEYTDIQKNTLDNVFLTLQSCMQEVLKCRSGNEYKLPHVGKESMRRRGVLPSTFTCNEQCYDLGVIFLIEYCLCLT